MFDLKNLLKLQQELQLSFAGNANLLNMDDGSFRATFSCDCAGSCKGTCDDGCYGGKRPGGCTFK